MDAFINKDFMLNSELASILYHNYACKLPIIDYHCHLDPQKIAEDYRFSSITELWLGGDHYKWRAMRTNGVDEEYITGNASDWQKFEKWAYTVPYTMRNPLYHWTHLELKTAFGIEELLSPKNAKEIYEHCNNLLKLPEYSVRGLLKKYNVEIICTTDDPIDSLEYHKKLKLDDFGINVLPAWRPDKVIGVENPETFIMYLEKLSNVSGVQINTFNDLVDAIQNRHDYFNLNGCRLSDHGIEEFYFEDYTDVEINNIFCKVRLGNKLEEKEIKKFKTCMLLILAEMDYNSGWVQQFHYGAIRNNNSKMYELLGADTGYDSIGVFNSAKSMSSFFDCLCKKNKLSKTIIYNLNPSDNEVVATMIGNFQEGPYAGKIQFGSGWWFLDQKDGMRKQMNCLSALGLISRFVGMLTDSRSFLSYPRHEYFRRILCDLFAEDIIRGVLPISEMKFISRIIENICYYNAKEYFEFK